tara:strand:- start:176 stop:376 length:201 start_codon:yes stop_codon:yes gene_type:complete
VKYVKTKSLTWWTSFVPLFLGLLVAALPLHGWQQGVDAINSLTGGLTPSTMINAGLFGIGLRGAVK